MSAAWIVVAAVGVLLVALAATIAYRTAHRLDRLHVRHDLSWQALDAALARRAVVARAVSAEAYGDGPAGRRLVAAARHAESAQRPDREAAENALTAELALVAPVSLRAATAAELADATARLVLARRFHNDAVRDTLALRERPAVRALRLGGRAALPAYFEIAETVASDGAADAADIRRSARVVLLDDDDAVMLLCGSDPAGGADAPRWWFTVGGAVQPGETLAQTAAREVAEETGLEVAPAELRGPVWQRDAVFAFNGATLRSREFFFVHRTRRFDARVDGRSALEHDYLHGHAWFTADALDRLEVPVYPQQLGALLAEAGRIADGAPGPSAGAPVAVT